LDRMDELRAGANGRSKGEGVWGGRMEGVSLGDCVEAGTRIGRGLGRDGLRLGDFINFYSVLTVSPIQFYNVSYLFYMI
jgi:hypothetical protein